jgi:hypothetical protein
MLEIFETLKKYNFWNTSIPPNGLLRSYYLDKIDSFIGNNLVKVLVGQRRVGKSYLLRQIIKKLIDNNVPPKNILYINKEFTDFDFISDYLSLDVTINVYKNEIKPTGKIYILIDEVQSINGWERLVNSYSQSYTTEYEIFISGSNSKLLSGELATLLSGRYVEFLIFPFNYSEYIETKQIENSKQSYLSYLQSGGLPQLFSLPNSESQRQYVSSIKDTIMLRDIVQRYNIKDARLLEDIFVFIVNNASNLVSVNSIVNYFKSKNRKTNYETVSNYLEYIISTFIIHKVDRYNIKGKETISGTHKYYANDLSFKNFLYSGYGYGIGYLLENLIFLQLSISGYKVFTGVVNGKEIDFVAVKEQRRIYIQVAYLLAEEQTIEREFGELEKIKDNYEKFVVSLDDIQLPDRNGIKHCQAWKINEIL